MLFRQGNRLINSRNWVKLVRPEQIVCESEPNDPMYGKFSYEPLERGYGVTIGNALRRVLLSSLQGAAFVAVRIEGVQHEFTTIPGVLEDVTDIILNIKQVRLGMLTDEPQRLSLAVSRKGPVTAADIQTNQNVEILNPDLHLATLTEDIELRMEFEVRMGMGYVPADMHDGLADEIGLIKLDASFSPVRKVAYTVEQGLRSANIATVGELVQRAEAEMLKTKNFGKKSLDEIKAVLSSMGLDFGMKVDGFEKKYQEWKRKQHHEA